MQASDPHGFKQNSRDSKTDAKAESVPSVPVEELIAWLVKGATKK